MSIEGFKCTITPKPVAAWLQEEKPEDQSGKNCHICRISPLANFYLGVLEEAQASDQIKTLETAHASGNGLTIAQALDKIKSEVGDTLRKDLEELDCFAQCFEE